MSAALGRSVLKSPYPTASSRQPGNLTFSFPEHCRYGAIDLPLVEKSRNESIGKDHLYEKTFLVHLPKIQIHQKGSMSPDME
jgi:hypothetical protein